MTDLDKKELFNLVTERLTREKNELEDSFKKTHQAAIEAPSAMQSHSDTTKFQMNIAADKIRSLISEKEKALQILNDLQKSIVSATKDKTIQVGSVVTIQDEQKKTKHVLMLPHCAGVEITHNSIPISVISPDAPLGASLLKKKIGDIASLQIGDTNKQIKVLAVE
jgi:transcription elongation GreA/GreB family factor